MDQLGLDIYNQIYERYLIKLNRNTANASINCNIDVGLIETENINNCNLTFTNECVSNSSTNFTLLLESLVEVLKLLPPEQSSKIEKKLGITLSELENGEDNGFVQECKAQASVNNSISVNEIKITNCYSTGSQPAEFIFVNSGTVESNCGMSKISEALQNTNIIIEKEDEVVTNIFGVDLLGIIVLLVTLILAYIFYCIIVMHIYKTKSAIYFSRNTIVPEDELILHNINIRRTIPIINDR
ncbi:ORF MSV094 putative membrane protein (vaccinia F9L), similar to SW:P24361 [Melanoplus sanguinipes entomopoxvirus]|uniref:ORF MSV094 putative membrane protein (Vaccinia F9L), similar to SW:P24361 n=1 Tax=Melanoplus sanguinipes entomopoxvirus TaxID=83191 RepID=Q9YVZ8_MSEPV|nr:ORF MSV094 putative membrane protein (vaccinia F9L), similar to SW:P24361 [Melanoplus sanguinipes entomopoxvirus]AAC97643.1 ORF MSV094 putative membrane protein (vaccinia F9L), similar to SW:P24361 [Melanoplus sanguinipes entomopoxvirus 'O']